MRLTAILFARGQTRFKYFQRYVEGVKNAGYTRTITDPVRGTVVRSRNKFHYDKARPWTDEFVQENAKLRLPKTLVEPIDKWTVFKGDRVSQGMIIV